MFEFGAVRREDIEPVIKMFGQLDNARAPRKFLESADASVLNGVCSSLVFNEHASPHFKAVTKFATCPLCAAIVHGPGQVIHEERLEHGAQVPGVDAGDICPKQPFSTYHRVASDQKVEDLPPLLIRPTKMVGHSIAKEPVIFRFSSEDSEEFVLLAAWLETARAISCPSANTWMASVLNPRTNTSGRSLIWVASMSKGRCDRFFARDFSE